MAVSRSKTWVANEILTAADLNAEYNNILNNQQGLGWPRDGTVATDLDGNTLTLDGNADTTLRSDTDDQIDIAIGGTDTFKFTSRELTILDKRVLTVRDKAELMGEIVRLRVMEAHVASIASERLAIQEMTNF